MSTLTVQTISNGTISTSTANVINGAKAWVNFDGTNAFSPNPSTLAIRASYNVSSITRNATGQFQVNFTNAFADANYCVQATPMRTDANVLIGCILGNATYSTSYSTSFVIVNFRDTANQNLNPLAGNVSIFR